LKAVAGTITAFLDGQEIVAAAIPCGTQGRPGLLVNGQENAEMRIRNVRVEFLNPTPEPVTEDGTDAPSNGARYVAEHGEDRPDARIPETGKSVTGCEPARGDAAVGAGRLTVSWASAA